MLTTLNAGDTIRTLGTGQYRAHRMGSHWIGDFATYAKAARALKIANSAGAYPVQRGFWDGGCLADEKQHAAAVKAHFAGDPFGPSNPVTDEDVRRTILPGEAFGSLGGWPVSVAR